MTFGSFLMGNVRGRLGNVVYNHINGNTVMKSYNPTPFDPKTASQMKQRISYALTSRAGTVCRPFYNSDNTPYYYSFYNSFISRNHNLSYILSKPDFDFLKSHALALAAPYFPLSYESPSPTSLFNYVTCYADSPSKFFIFGFVFATPSLKDFVEQNLSYLRITPKFNSSNGSYYVSKSDTYKLLNGDLYSYLVCAVAPCDLYTSVYPYTSLPNYAAFNTKRIKFCNFRYTIYTGDRFLFFDKVGINSYRVRPFLFSYHINGFRVLVGSEYFDGVGAILITYDYSSYPCCCGCVMCQFYKPKYQVFGKSFVLDSLSENSYTSSVVMNERQREYVYDSWRGYNPHSISSDIYNPF